MNSSTRGFFESTNRRKGKWIKPESSLSSPPSLRPSKVALRLARQLSRSLTRESRAYQYTWHSAAIQFPFMPSIAICVAAQDSMRADLVALAFIAQWQRVLGESTLAGTPTVILIESLTKALFQVCGFNGICAAKMRFPLYPNSITGFDLVQLKRRTQPHESTLSTPRGAAKQDLRLARRLPCNAPPLRPLALLTSLQFVAPLLLDPF